MTSNTGPKDSPRPITTLFPEIMAERPRRPPRRAWMDGPDNMRRFWQTRDERGLTYTQSRRLPDYFLEALSKIVTKKKWDKCLEEGRRLVVDFYPPDDPPWVKTLKAPEEKGKGDPSAPEPSNGG